METEELLIQAIHERDQVTATYNNRRRSFCPHAIGRKDGKRHVLVYQFAGEGLEGAPLSPGWRCLDIDGLSDVSVSPGEWHSAPNVFNPQSCMDVVDIVVQPFPPLARIDQGPISVEASPSGKAV
jgi:hypothetical protein